MKRDQSNIGIYTSKSKLLNELQSSKPVLLIIPAISIGKRGLSLQYQDYLDNGAKIYTYLSAHSVPVDIFVLGAKHRGEGFLHQLGVDYLTKTYQIPTSTIVWEHEKFRQVGLCSVEEVQLTSKFIKTTNITYQFVTSISKSQVNRYQLHQKAYGINSLYYVFPDRDSYYHKQNSDQEELLLAITQKDPQWKSNIGKDLRRLAHRLRDPHEVPPTTEEISIMQQKFAQTLKNQVPT